MTTGYLSNSLHFFRTAQAECLALFEECEKNGWDKVAIAGSGDLAVIAEIVVAKTSVQTVVMNPENDFSEFAAVLVTDIQDPQGSFEKVAANFPSDRILTPGLLYISRDTKSEGVAA